MDLKQTLITAATGIALLTNPVFAGGPVLIEEEQPIADVRPQGDGGSWIVPVIVGAIVLRALCQRCHNTLDAPMRRAGTAARAKARLALADLFQENPQ